MTVDGMSNGTGRKHKVTVIGSGNWGSAISKIVGESTAEHPELFEKEVNMWVYEELYQLSSKHPRYDSKVHSEPVPLTSLINSIHENPKYLPNIALPAHVKAIPSLVEACAESTILIFNVPHQFVHNICTQLQGKILPYARGISCIKGVSVNADSISLFTDTISDTLGIYCGALSGANIATEVAQEKFSETTIAYAPPAEGQPGAPIPLPDNLPEVDHVFLKTLFHRPYFHVHLVDDVAGVSLGGALKNVIALGTGFVDGLGWGDNAKAAVMRVGLLEMVKFGKKYFSTCRTSTFTEESCGVADLITSCNGGRNHRCAKLSVERGISVEEVEAQELNGQKAQGIGTAREVYQFLSTKGHLDEFPLMVAVYRILEKEAKPEDLPGLIETD